MKKGNSLFTKDYATILEKERPIVVMSRGHSGTRVLGWALDKLGIMMGTLPENPAGDSQFLKLTNSIKKISQRHLTEPARAEPSKSDLRLFQKRMVQYLKWMGITNQRWGWKFPETYIIGNYVEATFPNAVYIHMIRDGRDIAFKNHSTDRPKKLGKTLLNHIGALDSSQHHRAALSWDFQVKRYEEFEKGLKVPVHTMTFEDLIQKPVETVEEMSGFIGIEMTDDCRDWLEKNVDTSKISQHKSQDPQEIKEVEGLITPTLKKWGYLTEK